MKHLRKTIAATMTAMAVVVVAVASAPAASAWEPAPEPGFTYQVDDAVNNYGLINDRIPFFDISLDKVAEIIHESNDPVQWVLARVCAVIGKQDFFGSPDSGTCSEVLLDDLRQDQQLQYAGYLSSSLPLARVILDPTGYWVQDLEDLGS